MKKKLISMIMGVSMVLCMTPAGVLADESGDGVIDTAAELTAALEAGGEVTLGGDVTIIDSITINTDTTLDLNGHTITLSVYSSEDTWSFGDIIIEAGNVIIKDSVGEGTVENDGQMGSINLYDGTLTIESGNIESISARIGTLYLNGGTINMVIAGGSVLGTPVINKNDSATVNEWKIYIATFNVNPTDYLYTGYTAKDNGDGTYTTDYVAVEESGETYTLYFYDWLEEENTYYLGNCDWENPAPADSLFVEIFDVKGNGDEAVMIPMTKLDDEGKYWSAQIDIAYKNAMMDIVNDEAGVSTTLHVTPEKDGAMYSFENDWTIYGMDDTIDDMSDDVGSFSKDTVTADDKASLEAIIKSVDEKLKDGYLSDAQKESLENIKKTAEELIKAADENAKKDDKLNDKDETDDSRGEGTGQISPATGDSVNMVLWLALMTVTVSVLIGVQTGRNRRERQE